MILPRRCLKLRRIRITITRRRISWDLPRKELRRPRFRLRQAAALPAADVDVARLAVHAAVAGVLRPTGPIRIQAVRFAWHRTPSSRFRMRPRLYLQPYNPISIRPQLVNLMSSTSGIRRQTPLCQQHQSSLKRRAWRKGRLEYRQRKTHP